MESNKTKQEPTPLARAERIKLLLLGCCTGLLLVLLVALVAGGLHFNRMMTDMHASVTTMAGQMSDVTETMGDLSDLSEAVVGLSTRVGESLDGFDETMDSVKTAADTVNGLDLEALSQQLQDTVDGLGNLDTLMTDAASVMAKLDAIDIESLNAGIQKLNEVLTPLAAFVEKFQ